MIKKEFVAIFAVAALVGIIVAGNAAATVDSQNASTTQQTARLNRGNGIGQGVSEMMKGVGNRNGDQVTRLQTMIKELQDKLAKLTGAQETATTTVAAADLDCVKTAVTNREAAIATAFDNLTACQKPAFATRKTALEAAWGIAVTKDRVAAINKAWKDFDTAEKNCRDAYRKADKAAWDAFKTATKNCKVSNFEGYREGRDFNF